MMRVLMATSMLASASAGGCKWCKNEPTPWMKKDGKQCDQLTASWLNEKCQHDAAWSKEKWCQYSCFYHAGSKESRYRGDDCCHSKYHDDKHDAAMTPKKPPPPPPKPHPPPASKHTMPPPPKPHPPPSKSHPPPWFKHTMHDKQTHAGGAPPVHHEPVHGLGDALDRQEEAKDPKKPAEPEANPQVSPNRAAPPRHSALHQVARILAITTVVLVIAALVCAFIAYKHGDPTLTKVMKVVSPFKNKKNKICPKRYTSSTTAEKGKTNKKAGTKKKEQKKGHELLPEHVPEQLEEAPSAPAVPTVPTAIEDDGAEDL